MGCPMLPGQAEMGMVNELTKMKALYPVKEGKILKPVIPGA